MNPDPFYRCPGRADYGRGQMRVTVHGDCCVSFVTFPAGPCHAAPKPILHRSAPEGFAEAFRAFYHRPR